MYLKRIKLPKDADLKSMAHRLSHLTSSFSGADISNLVGGFGGRFECWVTVGERGSAPRGDAHARQRHDGRFGVGV